ncbi:MAG TPA: hypothetical protein VML94_08425 [Thermoplasmata archaeon]|nr:hypothetical protein [Thermoplasmata archaeon]
MAKKWLIGMVAAISVVCMAGVGFSAFTALAQVNGNATAATMGLEIVQNFTTGCYYNLNVAGAPGNYSFSNENAAQTSISLVASNLTPGINCRAYLELENTGSVPVNVSVALDTAGADGICTAWALDCFDVYTLSGIEASGWLYWSGSPTAGTSSDAYSNWATLAPGAMVWDVVLVDIPFGSDNGTPSSGAFSLVYTAAPEYGY